MRTLMLIMMFLAFLNYASEGAEIVDSTHPEYRDMLVECLENLDCHDITVDYEQTRKFLDIMLTPPPVDYDDVDYAFLDEPVYMGLGYDVILVSQTVKENLFHLVGRARYERWRKHEAKLLYDLSIHYSE